MKITINIDTALDLGFTLIPDGQKKVIQKALKFYLEVSNKLNNSPDASESFDLFDMTQLNAILEYPIFAKVELNERESFASNHGIDFPIYSN